MISSQKKMAVYFLIAIFFVILDRFCKILALNDESFKIFGNWFTFGISKNYYIAFSLPMGGSFLNILILIIIFCLLYFLVYLIKNKKPNESCALFFIILGAASNLFDRIRYGFVIDYFDLKFWPVFNIADLMIVGGVIIFLFFNLKERTKKN